MSSPEPNTAAAAFDGADAGAPARDNGAAAAAFAMGGAKAATAAEEGGSEGAGAAVLGDERLPVMARAVAATAATAEAAHPPVEGAEVATELVSAPDLKGAVLSMRAGPFQ